MQSGLDALNTVGAAVGSNTRVGRGAAGMVARGGINALNMVGEGAFGLLGPLLAPTATVVETVGQHHEDEVGTDMDAMAEMRKTNLELHRAIQADMKEFILKARAPLCDYDQPITTN